MTIANKEPDFPGKADRDIIHILYSGLGGHGSVVFSLLESSVEFRNRSRLVFYGIEPLVEEYKMKCLSLGLPYSYIRPRPGNPVLAWRKLYSLISAKEIDFIFLNSVNTIIPAALAARLKKKKLFVIEHMSNGLKTRFDKICSALSMRYSNNIIVLTQAYYQELKELLQNKFRQNKVVIIPNGIDTNKFRPDPANNKGFSMGMVSRFTPSKDHMMLVQAFFEFHKNHVASILKLAGDGETLPQIKQLVQSLGIADAVIFTGMLKEDEMVRFYQSLDIYVHISKGETMSTAIMQAMSTGLPVLASDVNGISNMLNADVGILVPNSVEKITSAMIYLAQNPELRLGYGNNGRHLANKYFSSTMMSEKYLSLLGDKMKLC